MSTTSTDPRRARAAGGHRRHARRRGAAPPAVTTAVRQRPDVEPADAVETELAQPIRVISARIWAAVAMAAGVIALALG